jgi:hypothetical protein
MKHNNVFKQIVGYARSAAYVMCAFGIALYLTIPHAQHAEAGLNFFFAFCALMLGFYFLLNIGIPASKQPKWERVFPELETEKRKKITAKRRLVSLIHGMMDVCLAIVGLTVFIDLGFDWRLPLIAALVLYIFGLIIRLSIPIQKEYSWDVVYPELALGFYEDDENN